MSKIQLVIEIPEAFEEHFKQDRFRDSLERVLEDCKHSAILSGNYEFETIEMLIKSFENGTPLDSIIADIEDAKAKDKLCEYPYVRCVEIIKKAMGHEEKTMDEGNK